MRINLWTTKDAEERGWGKGWPNCQEDKMVWTKAGGIGVSLHKDIAELIALLVEETVRRGYRLDKQKDDWGFCCRPITGSKTVPSNHSWGIAIDINAIKNPYQDNDGSMATDMPDWMPHLWAKYGFRWGGNYKGEHTDPMHYEFMGRPRQARKLTRKARKAFKKKED